VTVSRRHTLSCSGCPEQRPDPAPGAVPPLKNLEKRGWHSQEVSAKVPGGYRNRAAQLKPVSASEGGNAVALVRSDPFRDVDRLFQQLWNSQQSGPRPMAMPMDAYRKEDSFLLQLDLPGVASESIELSVEDNVLTISAERPAPPSGEGVESVISERAFGSFSRQIVLGKTLDAERIEANYEGGVLTVAIPVAEQAKPRRIEVRIGSDHKELSASAA
jgi:HSP20 family protein